MSANQQYAKQLMAKTDELKARAKASGSPEDIKALRDHAETMKRVAADIRQEKALKEMFSDAPTAGQFGSAKAKSSDLVDTIRAKGGFDVTEARKIVLGSVGQKALMSTPADAEVGFIGLAAYGRDDRFAYTAFPSSSLGSALSVDTLTQSARTLAAPGDMDVAIAGTGAKPESVVSLARSNIDAVMIATVTEPIPNAHWGLPSVAEFIRDELGYAVGRGIDSFLIAQLTGASGTNTYTQTVDTTIDTYRKALAAARADGFAPDVLLVHPNDAVALDTTKDAADRYYGSGPGQTGFGSVWGVKVVESNAVTQGSPILVDTAQFGKLLFGALSWGTNPYSTPTVDLWGTNNAVGRLETPMLVAVQRPEAIVEITLA